MIPKGNSGVLAGHGFQDQAGRSSLQATKAVWAEAVQVQAELVTPEEAKQVHRWRGGATRITPTWLGLEGPSA